MARKLEIEIIGDASSYQRALNKADTSTSSFGGKIGKVAKVGLPIFGAAVAGVAVGLKKSIDAAMESEKAQARLEQALDTAGVSFKKHGEAIDEAIQKTSKLAAVDDEELSDSFAQLVRNSGDVTKSIEGMNLAADISRARNISLAAATKMVEKAQAGQETAFSRIGIRLKENQTATDALAIAQERFGGAAEKYGNTAAGAQERLGVAFENLQEKIGAKVLPLFEQFLVKLTEFVEWVEANWPRIEEEFQRTVEVVQDVFNRVAPIFETAIEQIRDLVEFVKAVIEGDWSKAWEKFKEIVGNSFRLIGQLFHLWIDTIGKLAIKLGKAILDGVIDGVKALPGALKDLLMLALKGLVALGELALKAGADFGADLLRGIVDKIEQIPGKIKEFVTNGINAVKGLGQAMFDAAKGLGQRVVSGLSDGLTGVAGAVAGGISTAVRAAINFLIGRINSALEFTIKVPLGPDIKVNPPDIPYLAAGVKNFGGGVAVVGERGPELVRLPRGSDVIPNNRIAVAGGGGGITVHVHGSLIHENQLTDIIGRAVGNYRRRNGSDPF